MQWLAVFFYRVQNKDDMWFDLPQPPESRGASYMWPKRSPKCRTQSTTAYSLFWKKQDRTETAKGPKKKEETWECFFSRQNLEACELIASLLLLVSSVYSHVYAELMKKKKLPLCKGELVFDSCTGEKKKKKKKGIFLNSTGNIPLVFTADQNHTVINLQRTHNVAH